MHDIDRTQLEMEWEADPYDIREYEAEYEYDPEYEYEYEDEEFETYPEMEWEAEWEWMDTPFSEAEEMELASDFLEITDDAELEYFLGSLVKKASKLAKKYVPRSVRRAVRKKLKSVARQALSAGGRAVGSYFGGPVGGAIGGQAASRIGQAFGLELEGLSPEDQEFEIARRVVRVAGEAAKQAAKAPPGAPPQVVAQKAVAAAAQKHAPGLVAGAAAVKPMPAMAGRRRGRRGIWKRKGNVIVVYGA